MSRTFDVLWDGILNAIAHLTRTDNPHSVTLAQVGAAPLVHGHALEDTAGLVSALSGKASTIHVHAVADVTGLQGILDGLVKLDGSLSMTAPLRTDLGSGASGITETSFNAYRRIGPSTGSVAGLSMCYGSTNGTIHYNYTTGGTRAAPAATPSGAAFWTIGIRGHDGSGFTGSKGAFGAQAGSLWSGTSTEVVWIITGCSSGSTIATEWARWVNGCYVMGSAPSGSEIMRLGGSINLSSGSSYKINGVPITNAYAMAQYNPGTNVLTNGINVSSVTENAGASLRFNFTSAIPAGRFVFVTVEGATSAYGDITIASVTSVATTYVDVATVGTNAGGQIQAYPTAIHLLVM